MNHSFNVRFEVLSTDRVRAYVNDRLIGVITIKDIKTKAGPVARLVFRCSKNPFKSVIRTDFHRFDNAEEAMKISAIVDAVIPVVLRNALRNYDLTQPVRKPLLAA